MPFAEYTNFKECVSKNKDKQDPEAYCATIMRKVEGKTFLISSENQNFRTYSVETKGKTNHIVEGYIATCDKDLAQDILTPSALQDIYDQTNDLMVDLDHEAFKPDENGYGVFNSRSGLIPVGKIIEKRIDNTGVWVKAVINPHINRFKEIWGSLQDGFLKAFSIAFASPSPEDYVLKSDGTRTLNKLQTLLNVALTGNPVNPNATITGVITKSRDTLFQVETKPENTHKRKEFMEETNLKSILEEVKMEDKKENLETPVVEVKAAIVQPETKPVEVKAEEKTELKALLEKLESLESLIVTVKPPETVEVKAEKTDFKAVMDRLNKIEDKLKTPVYKATATQPTPSQPESQNLLEFII